MRWGTYRTVADENFNKPMFKRQYKTRNAFYAMADELFAKGYKNQCGEEAQKALTCHVAVMSNNNWEVLGRPYYNLWPGIEKALLKVDYGVDPFRIPALPEAAILVRVEESRVASVGFSSILFADIEMKIEDCEGGPRIERWLAADIIHPGGKSFYKCALDDMADFKNKEPHHSFGWTPFSLYVGICLLAANSTFIEPDVLNDDSAKAIAAKAAGDQATLDRLAERARKRGKIGWTVGRTVEVCPHLRRPHFGIRYTGPGGRKAELVPIKASIVRRQKMTEVPTGYLDADRVESSDQTSGA